MPPAFNLSQDQTLQFDLCKVNSSQRWPHPQRLLPRDKTFDPAPCQDQALLRCVSTSYVLDPRQNPASGQSPIPSPPRYPTPSTHTYRLQIVKERHCFEPRACIAFPQCSARLFLTARPVPVVLRLRSGVVQSSKQQRGEIIMRLQEDCNGSVRLNTPTPWTRTRRIPKTSEITNRCARKQHHYSSPRAQARTSTSRSRRMRSPR